jgi:hypothetical protein
MAEDQRAKDVLRRYGALKGLRAQHETTWKDCQDHSFPIRNQGWDGQSEPIDGVQAARARLYDSTGTDSARILASTVQTGITPSSLRWFGLEVENPADDERVWFDDAAEALWKAIHAANFDAESFELMLDNVSAGWGVLFIDESRDAQGRPDGLRFANWMLSECYCAASQPAGVIDTVYRRYGLTVEQCVSEFGLNKVSEKTRELFNDQQYDKPVQLTHAIYPRRDAKPGAARATMLPYASLHVEIEGSVVVRESGYHERPFVAPRWSRIPGSVYAVGPVFDALPDIKTLNEISRMELTNADMAIAGMWIAEDDGVLNPRTVKVGPRKIIVANSVDSMKPLQTGADFTVSFTKREQLAAQIKRTLMADQLPPMEGQPRTATEFYARLNLIRQMLGPVFGRLQTEYLKPLIERCFGLAYRGGLFPPPPDSLRGRIFTVTYQSPQARAQQLEVATAIEGTFQAVGAAAAAKGDVEVWDNVDVDEGIRLGAEARGAPAKIVRGPDAVARIRRQRAEDQQQAQAQAAEQQLGIQAAQTGIDKMMGGAA